MYKYYLYLLYYVINSWCAYVINYFLNVGSTVEGKQRWADETETSMNMFFECRLHSGVHKIITQLKFKNLKQCVNSRVN